MDSKPLKLRELLQRLKSFGIVVLGKRGKGSELILLLPKEPGSKKGPSFPIKNHGLGKEVPIPVIDAVLRRFCIEKKAFWGN